LSHDEFFGETHSLGDVVSDLTEDVKFFVSVGSSFIISSLLGVAPAGLLFEEVLELDGLSSVHLRLLEVVRDDGVVVGDLSLEGVSPVSEGISLSGEVSEFLGPSGSFSVFPTGISGSGGGDLVLEGGQEGGDLGEELWVVGGRGNLGEGVDQWSVSGELVVKVGHFRESLGDGLNSALELDEEGTSGEGSNEVDGVLASGDSRLMLGIKVGPSGVLHVSLGLTGFDSGVDRVELSEGGGELLFGVGEEDSGVSDGLVAVVSLLGVVVSVVGILREESVTGGSGLSVNGVSGSLLVVEFTNKTVNHINDFGEVVLTSRHVDADLGKDGLSQWVSVNLSKSLHMLTLGHGSRQSGVSRDANEGKN